MPRLLLPRCLRAMPPLPRAAIYMLHLLDYFSVVIFFFSCRLFAMLRHAFFFLPLRFAADDAA